MNSDNNVPVEPTDPTQLSNGEQAFATLQQFLQEDGWYPEIVKDKTLCRSFFKGRNADFRCFAQVRVDLEQYLFYAVAPFRVPEEFRPAVAEFITRANYGMRVGNFELDYSDGEVRYKSSLDFEGQPLTANLIKRATYPATQMLDRYMPGLMGVVYGGKEVAQAIKEIEG